jgi:hypothetical protein
MANAYSAVAQRRGFNLELPSVCVVCEHPEEKLFIEGQVENLTGSAIPQSADVVLVVEQKQCARPIILENLDDLAKELDRELKAAGLHDNRFGLVAFGGEGVHEEPHSHTVRGNLFTDARSLVLATKNMLFSTDGASDTYGALKRVLEYPYRTGVSKTVILFSCTPCPVHDYNFSYDQIQSSLLESGIVLHIVGTSQIVIKNKPSVTKQIVGVDAHTVYKAKDISQRVLNGEPDLRRQVSLKKDVCLALAQEVNGAFFNINVLPASKQSKGVFVRRVTQTARPAPCQSCKCEADTDRVGRVNCQPCNIPKPVEVEEADPNKR